MNTGLPRRSLARAPTDGVGDCHPQKRGSVRAIKRTGPPEILEHTMSRKGALTGSSADQHTLRASVDVDAPTGGEQVLPEVALETQGRDDAVECGVDQ